MCHSGSKADLSGPSPGSWGQGAAFTSGSYPTPAEGCLSLGECPVPAAATPARSNRQMLTLLPKGGTPGLPNALWTTAVQLSVSGATSATARIHADCTLSAHEEPDSAYAGSGLPGSQCFKAGCSFRQGADSGCHICRQIGSQGAGLLRRA